MNKSFENNFYLLFSEDSFNFTKIFNSSSSILINISGNKLNTFLFYGLKSFDSPPFIISFKENIFIQLTNKASAYALISINTTILIIIIFMIYFIRKKSKKIHKIGGKIITEEKEKLNKNNINKNGEILPAEDQSPGIIRNFSPQTAVTPTHLINGQVFNYDNIYAYENKNIN